MPGLPRLTRRCQACGQQGTVDAALGECPACGKPWGRLAFGEVHDPDTSWQTDPNSVREDEFRRWAREASRDAHEAGTLVPEDLKEATDEP